MASFFSFLSTGMFCVTILGIAFMVVLSLPESKMREVAKHTLLVVASVIYIFSPIDFMPEVALGPVGLLDDAVALYAAVTSARKAWNGGDDQHAAA